MFMTLLLTALAGAALGALIAWLQARRRVAVISARLEEKAAEALALNGELVQIKASFASAESLARERQLDADRMKELFSATSQEALRTTNEDFLKRAEVSIKPVDAALKRFEERLHKLESQRKEEHGSLIAQIKDSAGQQELLRRETGKLASALSSPTDRGAWGEFHLRRVLELADLQEHCDFETQVHRSNGAGAQKPDVVVHLPGGGSVVIDAKAPIDPNEAAEMEQSEERWPEYLDACAERLNIRLKELSKKSYWQAQENTPEFVVMYIPTESVYGEIMRRDHKLFERSAKANVIIATPSILLAMLRTIQYAWNQHKLAENAKRIGEEGADLHRRLATFAGHFAKIGKSLKTAAKSYNDAVGSYERSVIPGAKRLESSGISLAKELPKPERIDGEVRALERGSEVEG